MRRLLEVLTTSAVVALAVAAAASAGAGSSALHAQLADALHGPWLAAGDAGALAVDLENGDVLFRLNPDLPLEPASNEKLLVTYGALVQLTPSYRFRTAVLGEGRRVGATWRGRLVLKGFGDPSLTSSDLTRLAHLLYEQGIRRVTGDIVGDASWFDAHRLASGWRPSFVGVDTPPLSALVVDRALRNGRPVADPALAAAARFDQLLRARGIVARSAITGRASAAAVTRATVRSKPLPELLELMDRVSDNFTAEMVLKTIGAEALGKGSTAAGAAILRRDLENAGVPLAGARIVDGSGLSRSDRVTARELVALLTLIWTDPELRRITLAGLPVGGETGTLEHRLRSLPARGRVQAKTGTTDISSALSGYAGGRYVFALLLNGHPVATGPAEAAEDRFAGALAAAAAAGGR